MPSFRIAYAETMARTAPTAPTRAAGLGEMSVQPAVKQGEKKKVFEKGGWDISVRDTRAETP
jgi:hypothetical protein